ncbi:MAG: hypothetical protein Q7S17_05180 [Xanthobacteraceae bacterium]|nr:hypothetical protein [Xanthobacteraceae bacterium]
MTCTHIGNVVFCGRDDERGPWEPTTKLRPRGWRGRVPVHCCERWELPRNTETQWYSAFDGYVAGWRYRCAPARGCNNPKRPGYKRTAHLREIEYA